MDSTLHDEPNQVAEMIDRALRSIGTSLPGNVISFDPGPPQRVEVQPGIQMEVNVPGLPALKNLPKVVNVPLVIPFGSTAGFGLTVPIMAGDPVLLIFSQRAIDNWVDFGGVQPPEGGVSSRHHHLTDAFAILMPSPTSAGAFGEWDLDGLTIRNRDKTQFVRVRDADVIATAGSSILTLNKDGSGSLACPSGLTLSQDTTINGDLQVNGNINATGTITPGS